jgi:hypothetical protein
MWSIDSLPTAPGEQEKMERSGRKTLSGTPAKIVAALSFGTSDFQTCLILVLYTLIDSKFTTLYDIAKIFALRDTVLLFAIVPACTRRQKIVTESIGYNLAVQFLYPILTCFETGTFPFNCFEAACIRYCNFVAGTLFLYPILYELCTRFVFVPDTLSFVPDTP